MIGPERYAVFLSVAKNKSITKAARQLFLSQPAVSQHISKLEGELKCKLFVRSPKGVHLTPEGEVLFSHISRAFEEIEAGEKALLSMLGLESGEIRVGASDMTLQYFLLPHLERFHFLHPEIKISVTNDPTPRTLQQIEQGTIDFGAVSEPFAKVPGLVVHPVKQIRDTFVCGSKLFPSIQNPLPLKELEHLPIICLEKNTSTRRFLDDFLGDNGVLLSPEFELATSRLIVEFAIRNLGIGFVVSDFANEEINAKKLHRVALEVKPPARNICIVHRKRPLSQATQALLSIILS